MGSKKTRIDLYGVNMGQNHILLKRYKQVLIANASVLLFRRLAVEVFVVGLRLVAGMVTNVRSSLREGSRQPPRPKARTPFSSLMKSWAARQSRGNSAGLAFRHHVSPVRESRDISLLAMGITASSSLSGQHCDFWSSLTAPSAPVWVL